jgi:hypothetical protein
MSASILLASQNPLVRVICLFASLVPMTLLSGAVFWSLWGWFVTPLWPRPISYAEAVGLMLVVQFVRGVGRPDSGPIERTDLWRSVEQFLLRLAAIAFFWGLAAGFHAALF